MAESAGRFCPDCGHPVGLYDRSCRSCARSLVTPPPGEGPGGVEERPFTEEAQEGPEERRQERREEGERDPNIRAEDYGEPPSRPSWWRWIFGGGS